MRWQGAVAFTLAALLAVARAEEETSDVYTFYKQAQLGAEKELEAIELWNASWTRAGWSTHVLTPADAKAHPRYKEFLAAFFELPTSNRVEYEVACYMRWVAMSLTPAGCAAAPPRPFRSDAERSGLMTDYDVLNVGWPAPQAVPEVLTTLEAHVPAVVIGSAAEYRRAAEYFETFQLSEEEAALPRFTNKKGRTHLSDMVLVSYAIDRGLFAKRHLAFGKGEAKGENAPLVHFSHAAVHRKGEGVARNELMRLALAEVAAGTYVNT